MCPGNPFMPPASSKTPSAPVSTPDRPKVNLNLPSLPQGGKVSGGRVPGENPDIRVTDKSRNPVSRPAAGTKTSGRGQM